MQTFNQCFVGVRSGNNLVEVFLHRGRELVIHELLTGEGFNDAFTKLRWIQTVVIFHFLAFTGANLDVCFGDDVVQYAGIRRRATFQLLDQTAFRVAPWSAVFFCCRPSLFIFLQLDL